MTMRRILSLAALAALLTAPVQAGEEKYTIKVKKATKGQVEQVSKDEQSKEQIKISDNNNNVLKEMDEMKGHAYVYKQTTLEVKGDEKPTKLKRKYDKARSMSGGEMHKLAYEGKTVLIEKKGEKYTFKVEGGEELTGDDAKELDKEFNKKGELNESELEKLVLPPGPVKLNESWKVDPKVIAKLLQEEAMLKLNLEKTKATGKLTKVYRKDRRQFGVIVIHMTIVPDSMTKDGMTFAFTPTSKMVLEMTMDGCIDGSSSSGHLTFTGDAAITALLPDATNPMFRLDVGAKGKGNVKVVEE
jgi:hypothetical protein